VDPLKSANVLVKIAPFELFQPKCFWKSGNKAALGKVKEWEKLFVAVRDCRTRAFVHPNGRLVNSMDGDNILITIMTEEKSIHAGKVEKGREKINSTGITVKRCPKAERSPLRAASFVFGTCAHCGQYIYCGEGGIRTHDTVAGIPPFQGGQFNRSCTSPEDAYVYNRSVCIVAFSQKSSSLRDSILLVISSKIARET
jgi:hypothetical protein